MYVKGVGAVTLDEVRAASGTSKSQLYHHFSDKDALVHEVIATQAQRLLERQQELLRRFSSFRGLQRWRDAVLQRNRLRSGAYGCELGSLASELSDQDEDARVALAGYFRAWEDMLVDGLERMRQNGTLRQDADPVQLATGLMAALQGGYLLAQTARDSTPMAIALDMALDHIRSYATSNSSAATA
jgi:AcrR family transcriptional regulator